VLAGERRYRAALNAGLERVPAIVHEIDDAAAANLAVLDNLHRADLIR
jgi:ParB family chromosome partitioning protein